MKATLELTQASRHGDTPSVPGLVLVLSAGKPAYVPLVLPREGLTLGRAAPTGWLECDERVSRAHVHVKRVAGCWVLEDAGSRNGTVVDGQPLRSALTAAGDVVISLGHSLIWAVADVTPHLDGGCTQRDSAGRVLGAHMRRAMRELELAARAGSTVFVRGPSGAGKELAAAAYHRFAHADQPRAPFVAVNCATIPQALAEGLLFGARRGAYSGATQDTEGYVAAADGGTLFLDELAELEPAVQAKLLRVIETRCVTPLGATQPRKVNFHLCAATLRDLADEVAQGRFRDDLYYRVGRPEVCLPGLADRIDELPWLVGAAVQAVDPAMSPSHALIECCAARSWPGNVRELLGEVTRAAHAAKLSGTESVRPSHLAPSAGNPLSPREPPAPGDAARSAPDDAAIEAALAAHQGNVTGAARALGMHRNQLRRWLDRRS